MIGPGSHFCERIGRAHASNHVFFVVDFQAGSYSQKCHDVDCRDYRSAWMPLPPELCLAICEEAAPCSPQGPPQGVPRAGLAL
jgi:hypothetical protein